MTVASICQRTVDTVRPAETAFTAAHRMASRCVGTLVVVDDHGRPIGILTDRDLALRVVGAGLDSRTTPVAELMSGNLAAVGETTSIGETLTAMRRHNVRRLVVTAADGTLAGIVSLEDVLGLLAREMAEVGAFLQQMSPARLATS